MAAVDLQSVLVVAGRGSLNVAHYVLVGIVEVYEVASTWHWQADQSDLVGAWSAY